MRKILFLSLSLMVLTSYAKLEPKSYYSNIAKTLAREVPRQHVLQMPINDEISQKAFTNLVSYYDFDHSVFLKSDLDQLAKHEFTIDDEIRKGKVDFGYEVHNLYVERLKERIDFATNFVANTELDFSQDESYRVKRKDAPWPETKEDAEALWTKRIKNEALVMKLDKEINASTNELDVVEKIIKKYRQYAIVMAEPDEEAVLQNYLSAVLRAYDPHTDYMSPASKEDFDMDMNLTLCGVGAVLQMDDGALKIEEIMKGGPIDKDGRIKEGDKISGVKQGDGEMEDIMWQPMKKSIKKIRGAKGSKVTLEIIPRSDPSGLSRKYIDLIREEIKLEDQAATGRVETVTLNGVTNKVGYVYLPSFYGSMDKRPGEEGYRSSAMDVAKYLADFNSKGVQGLVLDLRGDGGGSLREAIMLSALFVPNGPVVQIRDSRSVGALPIPPGNPVAFRKPMIVLTDRGSASASEIVAAHLQDTGRAIVLGDKRSHGKGTVQTVIGLGSEKYGSAKITTARFYRVDGRSTQVEGVNADIHLPSLLDSLDIGEDKLPNALPFTKILPADYTLSWDMHTYVRELQKLSQKRTENDERYQKHLENVAGMKALSEREEVPLEWNKRKAMMIADKELRELDEEDEEEEYKSSRLHRNKQKKDDVVLDEAFNVMSDLIRLNRGAQIPVYRGWWL